MSDLDKKFEELVPKGKKELTQEEVLQAYEKFRKKQREAEKKTRRMGELILSTKDHDRHTCDCEGCKFYWQSNVIIENYIFQEVVPNLKILLKEKGIDLYLRDFILFLRRLSIVGGKPLWMAYDASLIRRMVYNQI